MYCLPATVVRIANLFLVGWMLICLAGSDASVCAQAPRVEDEGTRPADRRLDPLLDLDGYFPFQVPSDLSEWERRRAEIRRRILVATGLWPLPQLPAVEAALRVCNPSLPDSFLCPGENVFFRHLLDAMQKPDFTGVFVRNEGVLLHLRGAFLGGDRKIHSVEALAVVVISNLPQRAMFPPKLTSSFWASETPPAAPSGGPQETCCRPTPEPLFLGQFTPAVPLPGFAKLVGAFDSDFVRETWRYSRQHELKRFGSVIQEGSILMIKSSGCKMPPGKKLAWLIWVDERLGGMVDEQNNQLL